MTNDRLQSLDFLRGVAILCVILFHTFIIFDPRIKAVSLLAAQGVYGVQLFFFVSSLTMCLKWRERSDEYRAFLKFYLRRFFRIAPPFWLAMIGYLSLNGTGPSSWSPTGIGLHQILLTAFFLHGFWPDAINTIVPGGWSIAVEMTFYAIFPFLACINASSLTLMCVAFAVYLLNVAIAQPLLNVVFAGQDPTVMAGFIYFQFLNQAPVFLIGMAIFKLVTEEHQIPMPYIVLAVGWLALAFFLRGVLYIHSSPFFWLIVAALAVSVLFCVSKDVSFRPIDRIGQLSYSTYLTHFAIIQTVETLFIALGLELHSLAAFVSALILTVALCYVCASLLEATVEKWSALAGRWLIFKMSRMTSPHYV